VSKVRMVMLVAAAALTTQAWAQEDVEAVEKKIQAAWDKQTSVTAKIDLVMQLDMGFVSMDGKGEGTCELLRKGDKILTRLELRMAMNQKMGEKEEKQETKQLVIVDGQNTYTLQEVGGQKQATKTKVDAQFAMDPKTALENFRKTNTIKLLPEEKVDGISTYVFELTPKEEGPGPGRSLVYFDQSTGFIVKQVGYGPSDKSDKPMQTLTLRDAKYGTKIDPERFVFKAPEGVEVQDMTAGEDAATKPAMGDGEKPATQPATEKDAGKKAERPTTKPAAEPEKK
jgi:outer membrane lipoprotein-sorting protein